MEMFKGFNFPDESTQLRRKAEMDNKLSSSARLSAMIDLLKASEEIVRTSPLRRKQLNLLLENEELEHKLIKRFIKRKMRKK